MAKSLDAEGHEMDHSLTDIVTQNQSTNAVGTRRGCELKHQLISKQLSRASTGLPEVDNEVNTYSGEKDNVLAKWYIGMDGKTYPTHEPEVLQNGWNLGFLAGVSSSLQFHGPKKMQHDLRLEDKYSPVLGQIPAENQSYQYPDRSQFQDQHHLPTIPQNTPFRTSNPNSALARLPRPLKMEDLNDLRKNFGKKEVGDKSWKMLTRCNYFDSFLQYYGRLALPPHGPSETWQTQRSTLIRALRPADTKLLLEFIDAVVEFQATARANAASDSTFLNDSMSEKNEEDVSAEGFHDIEEQSDTPLINRSLEKENDDTGEVEEAQDRRLQKRLRTSASTASGTTKTENAAKIKPRSETQQYNGQRQLMFANYKAANQYLARKGSLSILDAANKYFTTEGLETIRMAGCSGVRSSDSTIPARYHGKQTASVAHEQIPNTWTPIYRNYGSHGRSGGNALSQAEIYNNPPTNLDGPGYWLDGSYGGQNFTAASQVGLRTSLPTDMGTPIPLNYRGYEDHGSPAMSPAVFSNDSPKSMGASSYGAERIHEDQSLAATSRSELNNETPSGTGTSGVRGSDRRVVSESK